MAPGVGEIERERPRVVLHQYASHDTALMINELKGVEAVEELEEGASIDSKCHQVKARGPAFSLRSADEQRQLRVAAVARDHERAARILGPCLVLSKDLET